MGHRQAMDKNSKSKMHTSGRVGRQDRQDKQDKYDRVREQWVVRSDRGRKIVREAVLCGQSVGGLCRAVDRLGELSPPSPYFRRIPEEESNLGVVVLGE